MDVRVSTDAAAILADAERQLLALVATQPPPQLAIVDAEVIAG